MKHYLYHICRKGLHDLGHGYIGVTVDPEKRWKDHLRIADKGDSNQKCYNFMRKFRDELEFRIIEEGSMEDIYLLESTYRPDLGMGWNTIKGGCFTESVAGIKCTIEGVEYQSMSEAARSIGCTKKDIKNLLEGNPTKKREALVNGKYKPVSLKNPETSETYHFESIREAWLWLGKSDYVYSNVYKQSRKGRPAYGYFWTFDTKEL